MAPQEPQAYPLKKLTELVAYLLDEIEVRERLAKKMKLFNTIKASRIQASLHQQLLLGFLLPHLQVALACLLVLHSVELCYFFLFQQLLHENILKYLP